MGWWGCQVTAGDTPMDAECEISPRLGMTQKLNNYLQRTLNPFIEKDDEDGFNAKVKELVPVIAAQLEVRIGRVVNFLEGGRVHPDDYNIYWQVFGVMIMKYGLTVSDAIFGQVIECALNDEWAEEDEERAEAMVSFVTDLIDYVPGEPKELTDEDPGLFGAIIEHFVEGKPGVINKDKKGQEMGALIEKAITKPSLH